MAALAKAILAKATLAVSVRHVAVVHRIPALLLLLLLLHVAGRVEAALRRSEARVGSAEATLWGREATLNAGEAALLCGGVDARGPWREALEAAAKAPSLANNILSNLRDGFVMTMAILPSIMSVGLIGLLLSKYTSLFDTLGYLYVPFTWLLHSLLSALLLPFRLQLLDRVEVRRQNSIPFILICWRPPNV